MDETQFLNKLQELLRDNYDEAYKAVTHYIGNMDDISIYYFLVNITGITDVPYVCISNLIEDLLKIEKIKNIVLTNGYKEFYFQMKEVHLEENEEKIKDMFASLISYNFDDFASKLYPYMVNYINKEEKRPVLWSKINTNILNINFTTIENSTFGSHCFFLSILFSNWNDSNRTCYIQEDLWKKLSKNFILAFTESNKFDFTIPFYFPGLNNIYNGIGNLFKKIELIELLNTNVNNIEILQIKDSNPDKIVQSTLIDITPLKSLRYTHDTEEILDAFMLMLNNSLIKEVQYEGKSL